MSAAGPSQGTCPPGGAARSAVRGGRTSRLGRSPRSISMMSTLRHHGRRGGFGAQRDRLRIAQVAARLIVEHGLSDWTIARRKAARQLMLPDTTAMPSNDEIEVALAEHHALFGGDAHAANLRLMRRQALEWMGRLAPWKPLLVGGVAAGWATEHSDVRLELEADDPKAVEMSLAGHGVPYAALPAREGDATTHLRDRIAKWKSTWLDPPRNPHADAATQPPEKRRRAAPRCRSALDAYRRTR